MKITNRLLIDHGYKERSMIDETALFQKPIKEAKGIKYYIEIHQYGEPGFEMYEAKATMYRDESSFTIAVHINQESIEEAEFLIESVWLNMNCDYDIYNN